MRSGVSSPGHQAGVTERGRASCFSLRVAALESPLEGCRVEQESRIMGLYQHNL